MGIGENSKRETETKRLQYRIIIDTKKTKNKTTDKRFEGPRHQNTDSN